MDQRALYRDYHQPIYHACLRILRSSEEAEECMQDAFIKLFTKGAPVFANNAACYAWLHKVAVRGAIDRLRSLDFRMGLESESIEGHHQLRNASSEETVIGYVSEEGDTVQKVNMIKDALASLSGGYRTILSLHLFEGYDFDEIAQVTRLRPSTVRSQYARGRQKLQEKINALWTR